MKLKTALTLTISALAVTASAQRYNINIINLPEAYSAARVVSMNADGDAIVQAVNPNSGEAFANFYYDHASHNVTKVSDNNHIIWAVNDHHRFVGSVYQDGKYFDAAWKNGVSGPATLLSGGSDVLRELYFIDNYNDNAMGMTTLSGPMSPSLIYGWNTNSGDALFESDFAPNTRVTAVAGKEFSFSFAGYSPDAQLGGGTFRATMGYPVDILLTTEGENNASLNVSGLSGTRWACGSQTLASNNYYAQPVIWAPGFIKGGVTATALPTAGFNNGVATSVNDDGVIVGTLGVNDNLNPGVAVMWKTTARNSTVARLSDLLNQKGFSPTNANVIHNNGAIGVTGISGGKRAAAIMTPAPANG